MATSAFVEEEARIGCMISRAAKPQCGQLRVDSSVGCDCMVWGLTFDMSGGPKGAKQPLERPLDGGVRRQCRVHEAAAYFGQA